MDTTRSDLERRYAHVSDEELRDRYASGTLTELAKSVVRDELRRRAIAVPTPRAAPATPSPVATATLVPIAAQLTWTEANILGSLLHTEGIAAQLLDEYLATGHPVLSSVTGGIRLLVPEASVPRVHEVIAALRRGDYALEEGVEPSSDG
jgi:hypothetical protein